MLTKNKSILLMKTIIYLILTNQYIEITELLKICSLKILAKLKQIQLIKRMKGIYTVAPDGQLLPDLLHAQRPVPWPSRIPPMIETPLTSSNSNQFPAFPISL